MSWREQTDWVSRKINRSIGIIRRVNHLVTTNCLLTLYYSLIYPSNIELDVYPYYSLQNLGPPETFCQKVIRVTLDHTHSSAPLFQKLQILTIYDISFSPVCVIIYKIHSSDGKISEHFKTYFKANSQVHSCRTRQSSDPHPPEFLTCRGQFSMRFRSTKLWNGFSHLAKKL